MCRTTGAARPLLRRAAAEALFGFAVAAGAITAFVLAITIGSLIA